MTTITFGKYNGTEINQVAMIDPSYCQWAVQNLKSSTWRKAFADALAATKNAKAEVVAAARFQADGDERASYSAYLEQAKEEKAEQSTEQKRSALIRQWANEIGKSESVVKGIVNRFWDIWQEVPAEQFSSLTMHQTFRHYMAELDKLNEW